MKRSRSFQQVDVFGASDGSGNPVAVVLDGEGLSTEQMQRFANWTNLAETTYVLPPTDPAADYRVRIFTPTIELPFAGHPTLGTCHAWRSAAPVSGDSYVQQCRAGLIEVQSVPSGLAFAAPPLTRSGPVDEPVVAHLAQLLGLARNEIIDAQWVDNGPGWIGVLLASAERVLSLEPDLVDLDVGVIGPYEPESETAFEVRAFYSDRGRTREDPVTGSLNASLAQWLVATGRANPPYVVSQGTALDRSGRVHISRAADETIWVGGNTTTVITGQVEL